MDPKAGAQESEPILDTTAPAGVTEAQAAPSPGETDGAPSSGAATEAQGAQTAAEAIRDKFLEKYGDATEDKAAEPPKPEVTAEAKVEQKQDDKAEKDDADDEFRLSDDEFRKLPERVRQRIGQLNAKAKKAERSLETTTRDLEVARDSQERMTVLHDFIERNGIEPQNVTLAFDMMAKLSRGDHAGFLDAIAPFYEAAQQAAGRAIAPDLREAVENGDMSEAAARELTQVRIKAREAEGRAKAATSRVEQTRAEQARSGEVANIVNAVNAREAQLKAEDPSYALKAQAVRTYMQRVMARGGVPKTVDDAVSLVNEAHQYATETVRPAPQPAPQATPRVPSSASNPSRSGQPPIASVYDAVASALEGYRPAAAR